jgi:hypothetical protein
MRSNHRGRQRNAQLGLLGWQRHRNAIALCFTRSVRRKSLGVLVKHSNRLRFSVRDYGNLIGGEPRRRALWGNKLQDSEQAIASRPKLEANSKVWPF